MSREIRPRKLASERDRAPGLSLLELGAAAPNPFALGTQGAFPRIRLSTALERRWLHYAFMSVDRRVSLVANIAALGPDAESDVFHSAILLLHEEGHGWRSSQWNAELAFPLWSAFRNSSSERERGTFSARAASGAPAVALELTSTSTPCSSQCATFHDNHFLRWQSEPGVRARGIWDTGFGPARRMDAIGYHERVRGAWGWKEMGGWVFGFCNEVDAEAAGGPPAWSIVFTLLQPENEAEEYSASIMVWRRGRLVRHFPRRNIRVSVAGEIERDAVCTVPDLAGLLGTPPTAPIPAALCFSGYLGDDQVDMEFVARHAARIVIPSEDCDKPYSVHEVVGDASIKLKLDGVEQRFASPGIVEFAGGAARSARWVY